MKSAPSLLLGALVCFCFAVKAANGLSSSSLPSLPSVSSSSFVPSKNNNRSNKNNNRNDLGTWTTKQQRSSSQPTKAFLSMHMGHSHTHHHQHQSTTTKPPAANFNPVHFLKRRKRLFAMLLLSALAIFVPAYINNPNHHIDNRAYTAWALTATSLVCAQPLPRVLAKMWRRAKNLYSSIARHSTPLTRKFFFQNPSAADRVTLLGAVLNLFLSGGKLAVGIVCHSSALMADAGHSLSDLVSDFVTLWAVQVGRLPPDEDHPYGHGKFEAIGSLFLSLTLIGTAFGVGAMSNRKLLDLIALHRQGLTPTVLVPGRAALLMAGISVVSKEWLFRITRAVGERLKSPILLANAWHHRSDAYSSILAVASIGLARAGWVVCDAAAGLAVAGMIGMTGAEILGTSIQQLTDTNDDAALVHRVTALAHQSEDVAQVVRVRARQVGSTSAVDVSVCMPEDRSMSAARAVEERLRQIILQKEDSVEDVDVRVTASPGIVCPLLLNRNETSVSAAEVEACVRDEVLRRHPEVDAIEGVTVHYEDSLLVNVDVDIKMDGTMARARQVASNMRDTLEQSSQIHAANIYLDLQQ